MGIFFLTWGSWGLRFAQCLCSLFHRQWWCWAGPWSLPSCQTGILPPTSPHPSISLISISLPPLPTSFPWPWQLHPHLLLSSPHSTILMSPPPLLSNLLLHKLSSPILLNSQLLPHHHFLHPPSSFRVALRCSVSTPIRSRNRPLAPAFLCPPHPLLPSCF